MNIVEQIKEWVEAAVLAVYNTEVSKKDLLVNETKPEFKGDYTLVTFALSKIVKKKPADIAADLGEFLQREHDSIESYEVVQGFLNLQIRDRYFIDFLQQHHSDAAFGCNNNGGKKIMVEYSSPNTNKPLHFGHLRNIFLGHAMSAILECNGHKVIKANLVNDRGIHICKSMIAWKHFADNATPSSTGIKGDHLVGDYYVRFNDELKKEIATLTGKGMSAEDAARKAPLMLEAQHMLQQWEAGDHETLSLWNEMNAWVMKGFYETYEKMGISFDKVYFESDTYLLGRDIVLDALAKNILYRKEDGSIWIDLTGEGLDHKLLLRSDGTSVYITQDIGTAVLKYRDYHTDRSVYVIGDEQNYHMQVLKLILEKMGEPCAPGIYHLSYGMVELPHGRMKSREGTVVDADDMIDEMVSIAQKNTEELGKVEGFGDEELKQLYQTLGLGALKFYLLRVDPKKKMIFNPQESIDFHGFTGPFVQYTHARICSILRKAGDTGPLRGNVQQISVHEKHLLTLLEQYPVRVAEAGIEMSAAVICNAVYSIAKSFNSFLVDHSVLKAGDEATMQFRLQLCMLSRHVLAHGLHLLGIRAPERM